MIGLQIPPNVEGSGGATMVGNVERLPQMKKNVKKKNVEHQFHNQKEIQEEWCFWVGWFGR